MTDDIDYESHYPQFVYAFSLFVQKMTDDVEYEHAQITANDFSVHQIR